MDIPVKVRNQKMQIESNLKCIVSGSQQFVRFVFDLTDEWDGLSPMAQFNQNGDIYNETLDEDYACYLPSGIQGGTCMMALYGTDGTTIATTRATKLYIIESGYVETGV